MIPFVFGFLVAVGALVSEFKGWVTFGIAAWLLGHMIYDSKK